MRPFKGRSWQIGGGDRKEGDTADGGAEVTRSRRRSKECVESFFRSLPDFSLRPGLENISARICLASGPAPPRSSRSRGFFCEWPQELGVGVATDPGREAFSENMSASRRSTWPRPTCGVPELDSQPALRLH